MQNRSADITTVCVQAIVLPEDQMHASVALLIKMVCEIVGVSNHNNTDNLLPMAQIKQRTQSSTRMIFVRKHNPFHESHTVIV